MADPFLGELKIVSFAFAPKHWAFCNGQLLPIAQNQALFSLLGTTFGGNGTATFALPDLRNRTPIHPNTTYPQGQSGGESAHTLTIPEMGPHSHGLTAAGAPAGTGNPTNTFFAQPSASLGGVYSTTGQQPSAMNPTAITPMGSGQAHPNRQPYLGLNICIALQGIYPSRP